MNDTLARSIAKTAADALSARAAPHRAKVPDEHIGLYLWHERGFRDHDTLVTLINHTREILDRCQVEVVMAPRPSPRPRVRRAARQAPFVQLVLDLVMA